MKKVIIGILTAIGALTIIIVPLWIVMANLMFPFFEWEYEELSRIESPNGQFEIVPFRGNAGAVSGYTYELYVVEKGKDVDRELDSSRHVFTAYEDTHLLGYKWVNDTVEIEIDAGAVHYTTYYGIWEDHNFRKVGDVVLKVRKL
jgi:hypothetical protein